MVSAKVEYDLLIIGGGPSGLYSAQAARKHGARVAIVEEAQAGGTCVHAGCTRKKILFDAANLSSSAQVSRSYGFTRQESSLLDWKLLKQKGEAYARRIQKYYEQILLDSGITYIAGTAKFASQNEVEIQDAHGQRARVSASSICDRKHPLRLSHLISYIK